MYKRILMAYDGSLEGRQALREGVLLGRLSGADMFLLAVTPSYLVTDALGLPTVAVDPYQTIFDEGLAKANALGVPLSGAKMAQGNPADEIGRYAREIKADLVVVGHRRPTLLQRWWAGDNQANLVDHVKCSVLVARNILTDEVFETQLLALAQNAPATAP